MAGSHYSYRDLSLLEQVLGEPASWNAYDVGLEKPTAVEQQGTLGPKEAFSCGRIPVDGSHLWGLNHMKRFIILSSFI